MATNPAKENADQLYPLPLATAADFEAAKISSCLELTDSLEFYSIARRFGELADIAERAGNLGGAKAYRVLEVICGFHFNPERSDTFSAQMRLDDRRTLIPGDFSLEQIGILASVVATIDHPLIRARVADVVWYRERKYYALAALAAESYCSAVDFFIDDKLSYTYEPGAHLPSKVVELINRSFQIIATGRIKPLPDHIKTTWHRIYDLALKHAQVMLYCNLSIWGQSHGLIDWKTIANESERFAEKVQNTIFPAAVQELWSIAARAYNKTQDKVSANRCRTRSVDQTLRMRDTVTSSMAKAYWTRQAIGELRAIDKSSERLNHLKDELQAYEGDSTTEYVHFEVPLEIKDIREKVTDDFQNLDAADMIYQLAFIDRPPEKIALHASCLKNLKSGFLSTLFSKSFADTDGKIIAESPSPGLGGCPPQAWFDHESLTVLAHHCELTVNALIKPACLTIMSRYALDDRHLMPITQASVFVPPGREEIFALGFARMFQGDMITACHLLIPNMESSLRHLLKSSKKNTTRMNPDLTQEDQTITQILDHRRPDLEGIIGENATYIIHLLVNVRGGPNLRHDLAHGKFTANDCFSSISIYACWLMFFLTMVPLRGCWESHIKDPLRSLIF